MIKKLTMYTSTFLPLFFIMWVKEFLLCICDVLKNPYIYTWKHVYLNPYLITEILIIILIGIFVAFLLKNNKKTASYTVKIKSAKNRSAEYYLAYYSLFILALIEFSLTDPVDLIVLGLLLVILGIVYIKNNLFFMNPTINIFQSYIYEIEYDMQESTITKLIISREKLSEGNIIEINVSEFEFTFLRRKNEQ